MFKLASLTLACLLCVSAHAQIFNFNLCYDNAAKYEQLYVQYHGDVSKFPLLVCGLNQAQTTALRTQFRAKYGY